MKLKADLEFANTIVRGGPNQFGPYMAVLYQDAYRVINLDTGEFPREEVFQTHQEAQDAAIVEHSIVSLKETSEALVDAPAAPKAKPARKVVPKQQPDGQFGQIEINTSKENA